MVVCRNSYMQIIFTVTVHHQPPPSSPSLPARRVTAVMMQFPARLNWTEISAWDFLLRSWCQTELAAALFLSPTVSCAPPILKTTLTWSFFFPSFFHTIRDMRRLEMSRHHESSRLQLPHPGVSGNVRTTMTKHFLFFYSPAVSCVIWTLQKRVRANRRDETNSRKGNFQSFQWKFYQ